MEEEIRVDYIVVILLLEEEIRVDYIVVILFIGGGNQSRLYCGGTFYWRRKSE